MRCFIKIRASNWHPFFVFNGEKITQVRADELKPGMAVIGSTDLAAGYDATGWLLGYIAGDGAIDSNGEGYVRVRIVDDSEECVDRFSKICETSYKISGDKRYQVDMWACSLYGEKARMVKNEFGGYQTSSTKSIPSSIWEGSAEKRFSFLVGHIDADGYYNKVRKRFEVFTVSKKLAQGLLALAGSLGIRASSRFRRSRKKNESDGWEIKYSSSQFLTDSVVSVSAKHSKLDAGTFTGSVSLSSVWKTRLKEKGINVRTTEAWRKPVKIGDIYASVVNWLQRGKTTRETAAAILRVCGEKKLANAVLSSQIVRSSKATGVSEALYDLTVAKNQTYIASDPSTGSYVVVHNTGFAYSPLRPAGCYIKGVNGRSCGAIGFIGMMSTDSEVIEQGGCLTNDTLINTKKGLLYFNELIKETEQGWYPQDLILKTKDGDRSSKKYYINGYSDILDITTDLGINIKGTPSHKLQVITENGFQWKVFKDINKGDYIVSKINQHEHEGQLQSLDVSFTKDHHNCIIPEKFPEKIDEKFAFFLGYYLGNGFSGSGENDYRNGVSIPDKSYLNDKINGIFEELFGDNITLTDMRKPDDQSKTYYVTNKIIKRFLINNGLLKSQSITASLPLKIRCSPRSILGSFLLGLFEADGYVCHGYPQLNTSSIQLAKEIQILLLGLGIPCKFFKTKKSLNSFSNRDKFCVKVISFKGLENWNKIVSPNEKSRFFECKNFKPDLKKERNYKLPHAEYWLKGVLNELISMKKTPEIKYLIKSFRRYIRGKRSLTLSAYQSLSDEIEAINRAIYSYDFSLEGEKCFLPPLEDYLFSKVISIDYNEDFTSDMEVEESHSYVANSLISHNSRRGANMGILEVRHPDIWEFIGFKNEHNWERLRDFMDVKDEEKWKYFKYENQYKWQMYNVSVAVNDDFLAALEKDEMWPFMWEGNEWELYKVIFKEAQGEDKYKEKEFEVTADCDATAIWKVKRKVPFPRGIDKFEVVSRRRVKASEIWDLIAYNAWADGCPGIINLSEMRRMHNLEYTGTINATNPCLHGDTLIAVADGRNAVSIRQLAEEGKEVPVYCRNDKGKVTIRMMRNPRVTGHKKKLYAIKLDDGSTIKATGNHEFLLSEGGYIPVLEIKCGDSLHIITKKFASFYDETEWLEEKWKVISVEYSEEDTVYNGTVDEYHDFYFGAFEGLTKKEDIIFTNGKNCGEQPLPANASCNLSSLVLSHFVNKELGVVDFSSLKEVVHTAVRFSDNVIDNCDFPLPQVGEKAIDERRVGLGTMGAHDMLIELNLGYDTDEGRVLVEEVLQFIRDEAYTASIELAREKGSFPSFNKKKYMRSGFVKTLPKEIQKLIEEYGIRNGTLLSQAPTGSIGAFLNASSGPEPWPWLSFTRNTRLGSYEDGCSAYIKWKEEHPNEPKPSYFKAAQEISPEDHVKMMIVFSKYMDSAVSKTINLPNKASVGDVKSAFKLALENGVKGMTVFRDGSKEGPLVGKKKDIIKEANKTVHELQDMKEEEPVESRMSPRKRGGKTVGSTYRVYMRSHNLYITVNRNEVGKLVEVFATVGENKNQSTTQTSGVEDSWAEGLAKMISLALRAGVDTDAILRNLKNIPSDKPVFTTVGDRETSEHIPSPPHAIARAIEEELLNPTIPGIKGMELKRPVCENCGGSNTVPKSPTCYYCLDCQFDKCG